MTTEIVNDLIDTFHKESLEKQQTLKNSIDILELKVTSLVKEKEKSSKEKVVRS